MIPDRKRRAQPETALRLAIIAAVLATVVIGCSSSASPTPSLPSRSPSGTLATARTETASASVAVSPLVGEWLGEHRCAHIVEVLTAAGLPNEILNSIVGNGLLPGVTEVAAVADPTQPCAGSIVNAHSHLFAADGTFASFDQNHQQVDDGTWRLVDADTIAIGDYSFTFKVVGDSLTLEPDPSDKGKPDFGWATMVSLPGLVWQRVAP